MTLTVGRLGGSSGGTQLVTTDDTVALLKALQETLTLPIGTYTPAETPLSADVGAAAVAAGARTGQRIEKRTPGGILFRGHLDSTGDVPDWAPVRFPVYSVKPAEADTGPGYEFAVSLGGQRDTYRAQADGAHAKVEQLGSAPDALVSAGSLDALAALPASVGTARLSLGERSGIFVATTEDRSALRNRDPMRAMFVPLATDLTGASGGWYREVDDEHTLHTAWWGIVDDRRFDETGTLTAAGTDWAAALNAIVDFMEPSDNKFVADSGGVARAGGYRVIFTRTHGGSGRFLVDGEVTRPPEKDVIWDGGHYGNVRIDSPTADYPFRFLNGGQGAQIGLRNLVLVGGSVEFVGSNNGHGITLDDILLVTNRKRLHFVDQRTLNGGVASPADRNITQTEFNRITCYGGAGLVDWEATTFSVVTFRRSRVFASLDTPIRIAGTGIDFEDLEFVGVQTSKYGTAVFIHLDSSQGNVSGCTFRRVKRFGSEDSTAFDGLFEPPHVLVHAGPIGVPADDSRRVSFITFEDCLWNQAHQSSNENGDPANAGNTEAPFYHPVEAGIRINCKYNNWTIRDGNRDDFPSGFIDDRCEPASIANSGENIVDMRPSNTSGVLFSGSGVGWTDRTAPVVAPDVAVITDVQPRLSFGTPGDSVFTYVRQSGYIVERGDIVSLKVQVIATLNAHTTAAGDLNIDVDLLDGSGSVTGTIPAPDDTFEGLPEQYEDGDVFAVPRWQGIDPGSTTRDVTAYFIGGSLRLIQTVDNGDLKGVIANQVPPSGRIVLDIVGEYRKASA